MISAGRMKRAVGKTPAPSLAPFCPEPDRTARPRFSLRWPGGPRRTVGWRPVDRPRAAQTVSPALGKVTPSAGARRPFLGGRQLERGNALVSRVLSYRPRLRAVALGASDAGTAAELRQSARSRHAAQMSGETVTICYGDAGPGDTHLLATVRAVDGEIIDYLNLRERRRARARHRRENPKEGERKRK